MGKISKVLFIVALISIAMCSCTKEEIPTTGNYVEPVGSAVVESADLEAGKVYGYLENQYGEEFLAEFSIPDTLVDEISIGLSAGEVIIRYQAIDQSYVQDDSGMFCEEHDVVPAEGNLEVSRVD